MALCRFIYGAIKKILCFERVVHVNYVSIDDLVITILHWKNDIVALWSCSGRPGAPLLGQDVVASLLILCMAKWPRKWRRGWLYVRSNTTNAKSLLTANLRFVCGFSVNSRAIDRILPDLRYIPRKICCREMPRFFQITGHFLASNFPGNRPILFNSLLVSVNIQVWHSLDLKYARLYTRVHLTFPGIVYEKR